MMVRILSLAALLALWGCSDDPTVTPGGQDTGTVAEDAGPPDEDASPDAAQPLDAGSDARDSLDQGGNDDQGIEPDEGFLDTGSTTPGTYVGAGDPYATGALAVTRVEVVANAAGPDKDLLIFAPTAPGTYAVVVFQHGFVLRNSYYSTLLEHVASHGYIVVAPQMYEPSFFGAPSAAEEAVEAAALYTWLIANLSGLVDVTPDTTAMGLAGHSRGAKVLWLALEGGFSHAVAAAGVEPVDGTGGPFGGEARVTEGGLSANLPSLSIGALLGAELVFGMACAPPGDNHLTFYEAAPAPAYHVVASDYGHLDMLDESTPNCGAACSACAQGPDDGGMRTLTGGLLVAFFRDTLQGDVTARAYLTGAEESAPVAVSADSK